MAAGSGRVDTIALSIHGPAGVLDLVVPPDAEISDIAHEYHAQTDMASIPLLCTSSGEVMRPDQTLRDAAVETGDVLVATTSVHRPATRDRESREGTEPSVAGPLSVTWFSVAGGLAVLAGWFTSRAGSGDVRLAAVALLVASAVVGVLPMGRYAAHRVLVAPAFAGAAAFAAVWDPAPERLPLVMGIAGLAAAVAAAAGRALASGPDEGLRVWMVSGAALFAATALAALLGFSPAVVWSVVLVVAVMAARFVPVFAVDVPDQYLIDLDRLAVTAWSARDRPPGRRGRIVVPPDAVARVAARAARTMTAAAASVAVAAALSTTQLVTRVEPEFDRIGARCLVFFAGAALLLTARSHRHAAVRSLLRVAGLACWAVLLWQLLAVMSDPRRAALLGVSIALGMLFILVAVATGRGWRSVWWSRRAEVAEGFCAAAALASVVVSTGLFRTLWEIVP